MTLQYMYCRSRHVLAFWRDATRLAFPKTKQKLDNRLQSTTFYNSLFAPQNKETNERDVK